MNKTTTSRNPGCCVANMIDFLAAAVVFVVSTNALIVLLATCTARLLRIFATGRGRRPPGFEPRLHLMLEAMMERSRRQGDMLPISLAAMTRATPGLRRHSST